MSVVISAMLTHMLPERCDKRSATALSTPAACTYGVLISDLLCSDESADERWQALVADDDATLGQLLRQLLQPLRSWATAKRFKP